jgi:hypothetical protein
MRVADVSASNFIIAACRVRPTLLAGVEQCKRLSLGRVGIETFSVWTGCMMKTVSKMKSERHVIGSRKVCFTPITGVNHNSILMQTPATGKKRTPCRG